MKAFFKDKFEYNFDANTKVIETIIDTPAAYTERAQTLMSHTLIAQSIWNARILNVPIPHKIWDMFDLKNLQSLNEQYHSQSLEIVKNNDLELNIVYTNTQGSKFNNILHDILYHIINHGTYHRGQIMTEIKSMGATPISTDYIFYKR